MTTRMPLTEFERTAFLEHLERIRRAQHGVGDAFIAWGKAIKDYADAEEGIEQCRDTFRRAVVLAGRVGEAEVAHRRAVDLLRIEEEAFDWFRVALPLEEP